MAYDARVLAAFSARPAYRLNLYVRHDAYSGNSQRFAWELLAERVDAGTAWESNPQPWNVSVHGQNFAGTNPMDFRNTTQISMAKGVTNFFAHDSNGYLTIGISASIGPAGIFGSAVGSNTFVTDRIAQLPAAPTSVGVTQITPTSMVYTFTGNADGGSTILEWQAQIAENDAFTVGSQTVASHGTTTFQNLSPGTLHHMRSRGRNAVGWSPWSNVVTATTLSGVSVGTGNAFKSAAVYVGYFNSFVPAEVRVGKDGVFVISS